MTAGKGAKPEAQNLRLADGRVVGIDAIHVEESLSSAGIVYASSAARAFHEVASFPTTTMPGRGERPIFLVPPVSVQRHAAVEGLGPLAKRGNGKATRTARRRFAVGAGVLLRRPREQPDYRGDCLATGLVG